MIPHDLDWPTLTARLSSPALHGLIAMMLLADQSGQVRTTHAEIGQKLGPSGASRASVYRTIDALTAAGLATPPARTGRGLTLTLQLPRLSPQLPPQNNLSQYILSDAGSAPDASKLSAQNHPTTPPTTPPAPARALTNDASERSVLQHQHPPERSKTTHQSAQKRDIAPVLRPEILGISCLSPEINTAAAAPIGTNGFIGQAAAANRPVAGEDREPEQTADAHLAEIVGPEAFAGLTESQLADLTLDNREAAAVGARLINAEFPSIHDRDKLASVLPGHVVIAAVRRADEVHKNGGFKTSRRAFLLGLLDGKKTSRAFIAECIADKRAAYQKRISAHTRKAAKVNTALAALEQAKTDQAAREKSRAQAARLAEELGEEKTAEVLSELAREDRALARIIMTRTREGRMPVDIAASLAIREAFTSRVRTIKNRTRRVTAPE